MAAIDFITALGRVLHDGALRDAFAADGQAFVHRIGLREPDRPAFLRLVTADLEFQALVLLRKRFGLVRQALPRTCEDLGPAAWPEFVRYGRSCPPRGKAQTVEDACGFAQHLLGHHPGAVCPAEVNRCQFAHRQRRLAFHLVSAVNGRRWPSLQVLLREGPSRWRECRLYLGT